MTNAKAKTIQLLLYDGTLNGVINIADSAWNPGEMYSSPRKAVNELVSLDKYGVYLLLSDERVYVGQAQDLKRRIKQHLSGKDWWERAVLLTTQDDSFTRTDIDYLESVLIKKADTAKSLDSDNKNKGNNPKIDKFRKVILDQYLDEALFLMELIGISVFGETRRRSPRKKKTPEIIISSSMPAIEENITDIEPKAPQSPEEATAPECQSLADSIEESTEKKRSVVPDGNYYITNKHKVAQSIFRAVMEVQGDLYIAKAGSDFSERQTVENLRPRILKARREAKVDNGKLLNDVEFDSPSSCASFILGRSANGWVEWKTADGKPIDLFRKKAAASI